ncbi:MAG: hypothetical protein R3286_04285 [Gammaproteobacteria bacterium]|nr:hypothetical protein [Gammaproteobacteria bacterium]
MKPFALWLCLALAGFGALGGGYHLYLSEHPRRILVAVDASYPMRSAWPAVRAALGRIEQRPYATFSLYTEKGKVHGWADRLSAGKLQPYAPRNLAGLPTGAGAPELEQASERVLVTNAPAAELGAFAGWRIVRPAP